MSQRGAFSSFWALAIALGLVLAAIGAISLVSFGLFYAFWAGLAVPVFGWPVLGLGKMVLAWLGVVVIFNCLRALAESLWVRKD